MSYPKGTVKIAMQATIVGRFAVHACIEPEWSEWWRAPFTVTHMKSGHHVASAHSVEKAIAAAEQFNAVEFDWDSLADASELATMMPKSVMLCCRAIAQEALRE